MDGLHETEAVGGLGKRFRLHPLAIEDILNTEQRPKIVETFRDMLSGMLDIYLSGVSNRTNEIMKVLTIITTLFIPLTFIAGLYGMNSRHMPKLEWLWGYPFVWIVMIVITALMVIYFRRKKWL